MVTHANNNSLIEGMKQDIKSILNCIDNICKTLDDGEAKTECLRLRNEYTNFYNELLKRQ